MKFVPGACLVALLALAAATDRVAAKPPDLPNNPPIIVETNGHTYEIILEESGLQRTTLVDDDAELQRRIREESGESTPECEHRCPLRALCPATIQQAVSVMLWINVHPLLTLFPPTAVGCPCGEEPCEPMAGCCPPPAKKAATASSAPTCPFLQAADKHAGAVADVCVGRSVLENLDLLEKAGKELEAACKLAQQGNTCQALEQLERVRQMVPGSSFESRVEQVVSDIARGVAGFTCGEAVPEAAAFPECGEFEGCCGWIFGPIQQFGLCQVTQASEWMAGAVVCGSCKAKECAGSICNRTISLHVENMMLQAVFDNLRTEQGVPVCVDVMSLHQAGINLCQPVTLHVDNAPVRVVFDILLQPFGLRSAMCGDCICVTANRKSCCEQSGCTKDCCEKDCCEKGCCEKCPECKKTEERPKSEEASEPQSSVCPQCEKLHANLMKQACKRRCEPGVEEQVRGLMKACYLALEEGRNDKAVEMARQAHALDPSRVEADPVVYKLGLLAEQPTCTEGCPEKPCCPGKGEPSNNYPDPVGKTPEDNLSLRPQLPGVDPNVVVALDGLLVESAEKPEGRTLTLSLGFNTDSGVIGSFSFLEDGSEKPADFDFDYSWQDVPALIRWFLLAGSPMKAECGHLTLGCSLTGGLNACCLVPYEGTKFLFVVRDNIPFVIALPKEEKTLTPERVHGGIQ